MAGDDGKRSLLSRAFLERDAILNAPVRRATERLFRHIVADDAWIDAVRAAAQRGPLMYVIRNVSVLDYLALDHLTHRLDLPRIGFANELPPAIGPRPPPGIRDPAKQLCHTVQHGGSAALFLKRAPQRIIGRGRSQGDELLDALLALQAERADREIMMLPQTFVWTQRPEQRGFSLTDALFGPAEFPGEMRMAAQFLLNYKHCLLRAGDPLSLREFQAAHGERGPGLVRQLTYALLSKVERERRTIVGPAHKPPDRVREEVLRSPKLTQVIEELAGPSREARGMLVDQARGMLREMQTIPDTETQQSLTVLADQILHRVYTGIDVDDAGLERLRQLRSEGAVVLLPSHKSHVDYIVLSFTLRQNNIQIPVIAAGDNLSFFPAGPILRRCGAFFIRRKFRGDRLYTAVVDAYLRRLLRDGWMVEFFLEGGRSRTGKLLPPMLGLLNMVVSSAMGLEGKRVFFVPVSIGYERLMEEDEYARELSGGEKQKEDARQLLAIGGVLTERWGRVNIQFGEAVELRELQRELDVDPSRVTPAKRRAIVKRLAHLVMSDINRVTAVTPGAVVALTVLGHGRRGIEYRELLSSCDRLVRMLLALGARPTESLVDGTSLSERGIRQALELYVKSGLLVQHVPGDTLTKSRKRKRLYSGADVIFTVPDDKRLRLDLAKNHIVHWLVDRALVSTALTCQPEGGAPQLPVAELRQRVLRLSRLFKYEFMFRADARFEAIFEGVVGTMVACGELCAEAGHIRLGPGHDDLDGAGWAAFYATTMRNFIEAYRVAARGLQALVKGPLEHKDLLQRSLRVGERMFLQGEIERSEAVSRPILDNAISSFVDQGYLVRERPGPTGGKNDKRSELLALSATFASEDGARTVEQRIAAFL